MQELGKIHQLVFDVFGYQMVFNLEVMLMTWIVICGCCFLAGLVPHDAPWSPTDSRWLGSF